MSRGAGWMRNVLLLGGALSVVFAIGFVFQLPWATAVWPWKDGRLSYIFLGSILAATGTPILWIGWSQEWRAVAAGAADLVVMFAGFVAYLAGLFFAGRRPEVLPLLAFSVVLLLVDAGLLVWSRRIPYRDPRPMPQAVRGSFVVFVVLLVFAATMLITRAPNVFPWPLNADSSVMFGFIFLGAAVYFLSGLLDPHWANARGQLWGFLAYDIILIPPFLQHFATVQPAHRASLIVYTLVLFFSAALALYYLLLKPATRGQRAGVWRRLPD